ncbi:cytochrome-c peroxidase [Saccharomycopsis crataegensis]|uniref:Peroxidase n=1 Tax=Saccharomycopsis crataegensis TaxID=43959 RepID=A0AAV5QGC7_9ASCO|nr:cytochrome-c peroxidase [Saccharomycopsis crataegensis]
MFKGATKRVASFIERQPVKNFKRFNSSGANRGSSNVGLIAGGSLLVGAGAAYYLTSRDHPSGKKLASAVTAGSIVTSDNQAYASQVGDGASKLYQAVATTKPKEAYQEVYNAVAHKIQDEDEYDGGIGYGPILVRLAWHLSGSYSHSDHGETKGGSYGGTMVHKFEASDPGNAGLEKARKFLESVQKQYGWISIGDLYTLAGVCAIQEMAGPKINWRPGRKNLPEKNQPPHGRLPDASQGATHIRAVFSRLSESFTDEQIAALIGVGHAIGKCHKESSGYEGPWTFSPNMVTNQFFDLLLNEDWQIKKWSGPTQFEDKKTQSLMMLPADFALSFDPGFKKISKKFAEDQDTLFTVFAGAFAKLLELGTEFPKDQKPWQFKTLDEQEED